MPPARMQTKETRQRLSLGLTPTTSHRVYVGIPLLPGKLFSDPDLSLLYPAEIQA